MIHKRTTSGSLPRMSLVSAASSSSLYSTSTGGAGAGSFPAMPPSPTVASPPEHVCFMPTQKCLTPAAYSARHPSRVNLEGSWLDLESDAEDDADAYSLMRMRRKSSGASAKSSAGSSGRAALANFRELTRRSSMHLRKLTGKMAAPSSG
ncbi:hypothetical protein GGI04_005133 [Coemansia thaxteri]